MLNPQTMPPFDGLRAVTDHHEQRSKLEKYIYGQSSEPPAPELTRCNAECQFAKWLHHPNCRGLKDVHLHNQICDTCEAMQSQASQAVFLMNKGKVELAKEVIQDGGIYVESSNKFQQKLALLHYQLIAGAVKSIESDFESRLFEIMPAARIATNNQQISILIVGDDESAETVKSLLDGNVEPDVRVLTRNAFKDGMTLLSSDTNIALALLLWQGDTHEQLPDLVRSIFEQQSNPMQAIMVRSRSKLPEKICATLWRLGVVDRSFNQSVKSPDLIDSVAVVMRNYHRQITLNDIPALCEILSGAKNLRDLALLSLHVVHGQRATSRSGLFSFLGGAGQPMLIAGTGRYENQRCIPLEQMDDPWAKSMIQNALDQCRSQFGAKGAAIYLRTPGGYTACIYFTLDSSLNPWEIGVLRTISNIIVTSIDQSMLAQQLLRSQQATITTLSVMAEYRDAETGDHVARVARMTTEIAHMLSQENKDIDARLVEQVGLASILHDTGKIAISDEILLKPGPFNAYEQQVMEQHVIFGHDILNKASRHTDDGGLLKMSAEIARYHHERFDGSGYPEGLKGEEIPISARIVALADVYDALISRRPYKESWSHDNAVELIRAESGSHFDPKVVDAFLRLDELKKSARYIEWSDAMSVGSADLDFDHQRLIEIINRLWVANSLGNRQIIEFVLNDLVNYTELHFAREESMLEHVGFSDSERHFSIHKSIRRQLDEFRWEYFHGIRDELRNGLLEFVTAWLNHHILEEDMQYSCHFAAA